MKKQTKKELNRDRVQSEGFHVGIELELKAKCEDGCGEHDDDACFESRRENYEENLSSESAKEILMNYIGLNRNDAASLEAYFDKDQWISDYMCDWSDDGCDYDDCSFGGNDGENTRDEIQSSLKKLTGNNSIKVVSDSSIKTDSDQTDAEVCWNYYASKETIKDNTKILEWLKDNDCEFDTSCGLHINLNNYLKKSTPKNLDKKHLEFLFNIVAPSRRESHYCNDYAISENTKYSMIYNQNDRWEFRFFSPTLDAEKLNHYVSLANVVYKRLCGKNAKLSKKSEEYFLEKMTKTNGLTLEVAKETIMKINNLLSYDLMMGVIEATNLDLFNDSVTVAESETIQRRRGYTLANTDQALLNDLFGIASTDSESESA